MAIARLIGVHGSPDRDPALAPRTGKTKVTSADTVIPMTTKIGTRDTSPRSVTGPIPIGMTKLPKAVG